HALAIRIWDPARKRLLREIRSDFGPIQQVVVSPDARVLATAVVGSSNVEIWETATGDWIGRLAGHLGRIRSVAFLSPSPILVTGSEDRTALLWDLRKLGEASAYTRSLSEADVERMWNTLGTIRGREAHQVICLLARCPRETSAVLRKHMKPI